MAPAGHCFWWRRTGWYIPFQGRIHGGGSLSSWHIQNHQGRECNQVYSGSTALSSSTRPRKQIAGNNIEIIPIKRPHTPNPKPPRSRSLWYEITELVFVWKYHLKNTKTWNTRYYECISLFSFSNKWNLFCFFKLKSCLNHCTLYQVFWVISLF